MYTRPMSNGEGTHTMNDLYAVYESGDNCQLSESMPIEAARQWVKEAYENGETRVLAVRICEDNF